MYVRSVAHVLQDVESGDSSSASSMRHLAPSHPQANFHPAGYQLLPSAALQPMPTQDAAYVDAASQLTLCRRSRYVPYGETTTFHQRVAPRDTSPMDGHGRAQQSGADKNLQKIYNAAITSYFDEFVHTMYTIRRRKFIKIQKIDQNKMLKFGSSLVHTTTSLCTKKEGINPPYR